MARELTVAWILPDKKLIKFVEEENDTYDLEVKNINEIKENDRVQISTNKDNVIIAIKKVEASKVKEEVKKVVEEEKKEDNDSIGNVKKVKVIDKKKRVIKFENDKVLYSIPENIREEFKEVKKGVTIDIQVGEVKVEGEKPLIIKLNHIVKVNEKVEEKKVIENIVKEEKSFEPDENVTELVNYYRDSKRSQAESIERQVAVKEAAWIVRTLIEKGCVNENKIKGKLMEITKICLNALNQ